MRGERDTLMRNPLTWLLGLLVMCWLGGPGAVSATTSGTADLAELAAQADLIVDAVATESASFWFDGTLLTRVHLEVYAVVKGRPTSTMTLLLPGGVDLDREIPIAIRWPGAPEVGVGERALLFLRRSSGERPKGGDSYYSIVGFSRGKLSIQDEDGDLLVVDPSNTSGGARSLTSVEAEIRRTLALNNREAR